MQNVSMLSEFATVVNAVPQQQQQIHLTERQRVNQIKLETNLQNEVTIFHQLPKPGTIQPLIVDETKQYMEGLIEDGDDSDGEKGGKGTSKNSGKKTRGRVKIKMEFIQNKLRRYTTFSKRKTGIMKKAYELSTLTGTQVMLLVASETGHVYTFATRKLQPMITSESGKALIQTCLNSPDPTPTTVLQQQPLQQAHIQTINQPLNQPLAVIQNSVQGGGVANEQRMNETVFEDANLQYQNNEELKIVQSSSGSVHYVTPAGQSFPIATYIAPASQNSPTSKQVQVGSITTIFTPSGGGSSNATGSTPSPVALQTTPNVVPQHQPQILSGQLQLHRIHPQNIILTGNTPCIQQNHIILNQASPTQPASLIVSNPPQQSIIARQDNSPQQHDVSTSQQQQQQQQDVITFVNTSQQSSVQPIQMIYNSSSGSVIYAARQNDGAVFKRPAPLSTVVTDQVPMQHTPVIQTSGGELHQDQLTSRHHEPEAMIVPRNQSEVIK